MGVREGVKEATDGVSKRVLRGVGVVVRLFAVGVDGGAGTIGTGVCRGAEKDGLIGIGAGLPFVACAAGLLCSDVEMEATVCGSTSSAWPESPCLGQTYLLDRLKG